MDMRGRVALVTGGSRGIGQAIAVKLAEVGIDVDIGYEKNQAKAEEVVQHITALGRRAMAIGTDLRDPQQIAALVQSTKDAFGRIDILVNNAAIGPQRSLEAITVEEWDQVMEVNLRSSFLLSQ